MLTLVAWGCGPESLPTSPASSPPPPPTIDLTTLRAVRPNTAVGLVPFAGDVLVTLPAGDGGQYGGDDAQGWQRFVRTRLGPLVDPAGGPPRIAAAAAVRDDLVIYTHAQRDRGPELVVYRTRRDELLTVAGTAELRSQLAAGASLDLASSQLVAAGDTVWLILRLADRVSLLRLDARQVTDGTPRVSRPFESLRDGSQPFRIELTDVWFTDANQALALLRPATGAVWRVAGDGRMTPQPSVTTRRPPAAPPLTWPAPAGETARSIEFFAEAPIPGAFADARAADARPPDAQAPDAPPDAAAGGLAVDPLAARDGDPIAYPIFVLRHADGDRVIDRDAITARLGFPTHALRLATWCIDPTSGDVIAYDAMSGEVLRVTIKP